MNGYLSRLNPAERRFVIVVGLAFFIVVNIFWIWPHFDDWGQLRSRLAKARSGYVDRAAMIQREPQLNAEIKKLASEGGYVPPEDQALQFLRTIQVQAAQSGVGFQGSSRAFTSTNLFFVEHGQTISTIATETSLVDFLYNLGSGNSLIRVREISIRPDPARQKLNANITLVASYQKSVKAPARPGGRPPAKPANATAQPADPTSPPVAPAPRTPSTPLKK